MTVLDRSQVIAIGDQFIPHRDTCGFYPQDLIGRQNQMRTLSGGTKRITNGQKRLYDRLIRYAGRDGRCYPAQETLARELGISSRQVRRDLEALKQFGLIGVCPGRNNRSSRYLFLWHNLFDQVADASGSSEENNRTPTASQADIYGRITGHGRPTNTLKNPKTNTCSSASTDDSEKPANQSSTPSVKTKLKWFSEEFWPLYPRKIGKPKAEEAFIRRVGCPEDKDRLIQALTVQLDALTEARKFCPHPSTWLDQRRDEDDVPERVSGMALGPYRYDAEVQ